MNSNDTLRSYFMESMFLDGIIRPLGLNIAPKADEDIDLSTGYKFSHRCYGVKKLDINHVRNLENGIEVSGGFSIFDEKQYTYHWNNETEVSVNMGMSHDFRMVDNGGFRSCISIDDDSKIKVVTIVQLDRSVVGVNYDNKSIRDGILPNIEHDTLQTEVEIVEYYQLLSNGRRVLHFSPQSSFFEVYDVTDNFDMKLGLDKLTPKVFDDQDYDDKDLDLGEINNIISLLNSDKEIKKALV